MKIEVLYFEDCPNYQKFVPHLRALLDGAGVSEEIEMRRVASTDEAVNERFLGSPTLRINGTDVDPAAAGRTSYGLQCRLYATSRGFRGAPPDELVLPALQTR